MSEPQITDSPDPLERLSRLASSTLSDADKSLRVLPVAIRPVGTARRMVGRAVTVQANGDLISVLAGLRLGRPGDVLVIAAGVEDLAVAGELFATEAVRRGLAGMIIDGLCRDTETLARLSIPVFARGATPKAAPAQGVPEVQVPISVAGVPVSPGDLVISDDDGIVVGSEAEIGAALEAADRIHAAEANILAAIADGVSLFDKLNFDDHVARRREGQPSALTFLT
ncbi:MAG TPA: RraA family protein [Propionibacteriaceae bacterium]|nr:RraA family protein [Propionibacteriaceae bacterium]